MKIFMFPSRKISNIKNKSLNSLFFNYSKIEKFKINSKDKNYKEKKNKINNSKKIKKQIIDENILNKSKTKVKTSINSNNNSFNDSFINKSIIRDIISKKKHKLNNNICLVNASFNNSKSKIYTNKKDYHNGISIKKINNKRDKIFNESFNNNKKIKIDIDYNGINIMNYKKKVPNIKKNNNDNNNIKDLSGDINQNLSIKNNSNSFNMNSIDHLFYRSIMNISSLSNTKKQIIKKLSSNINPINNINQKNISKKKILNKVSNSFSHKKNKIRNSFGAYNKKREKSYINNNNNSIINNSEKQKNIKINQFEKKNKKKNKSNIFQPKNIFSKFKQKKNNVLIYEEILLNQKLLVNRNSNTNTINKLKFEGEENDKNINKNLEEKEIKLDLNNNKYQNSLLIENKQNNQNTQMNSYNILSNITLITGTDNYINNVSQNIIEDNNNNLNINNNNSIFKGKKISCIHDISKTGLSGEDKKVNQDRYFIFRNFVTGFENIFMGVLDGHGYYGQEVSEYIRENLPMDLNRILKAKKINLLKDDLSEIIKNTFEMENNSLLRNKQIDSNLSGSTCVSVIYTPEKLIIANLGDSRCVLGKKINNEWKVENLTRDHKPSVPEEADRIRSYGGRIRPMKDEEGNFIGPLRVYMKEKDIPGLAMTRSFGDYYASTAGTIPIPDVREYKLNPEDKFLILASDGLFEFIDSNEVVNIVSDYYAKKDIVGCSEFLYKESYRKWIYEEEDTVDDITIILVFFED